MRPPVRLTVLVVVLSSCWLLAARTTTIEAAVAGDATLVVANLRFQGSPHHALRALLLQDNQEGLLGGAAADQQLAAAEVLDFERTYDRATDSWRLSVALPAGRSQPALVQLWCRACRVADNQADVTGLIDSQDVASGEEAGDGTVVLVLDGAALPAAAGATAASTSARKLQQTSNCALMLGGQAFNFASCTQPRTAGSYTYTVFSTVVPNGTSSLLKMGLVAKTGGGWAGWGLPKFRGVMLGASAVIVWPTATGAQVSGFRLPESSYDAADINAAMGTFPILQAAAENVAGELRAVFTISMSDAPADTVASAAGVNYIYAIGPMGSSGAPGLGDHTRVAGYPYGSDVFQMKQEVTSVAPAPSSPPPSPPTSPAATVPAPKSEGAETATVPSLSSTGAAGNGGCSLQLSEGAAAESFTGCSLIQGVGVGFYVMWRTEPIASNPTKLLLTMGMNATTSGYVAVGFPVRPEHMVGSTSMILQTCPADSAGCTNGVKLSQWYLASTESSGVNPSNSVAISNIQAAALSATGQLVGSFQLEVDAPPTSGRRRLLMLENSDGSMPLIFAAGNVGATGKPLEHSTDGAATLAVASISSTGSPSTTVEGGSSEEDSSLKSAHAWMAAIGWGVLIPMGVVMARSFKEAAPLWFHLHRGMQTFGFILGTISLGLGFKLVDGEWAAEDTYHTVHRNLGVACTVLGFTQFSALVVRPKKGEKYRFAWELWHAWVGRSAAVLAIANIYYGILHMWDLGPWTWASYTAVLASIVAVAVAKDTSDWLKARRLRSADHVGTVQLTQPPLKVSRSPSEAYANMPA